MKEHLKSASARYKQDGVKITPISEIDAEIITEISQALLKIGEDKLKGIVDQWKFLKDEDVRDLLLDWHLNTKDKRLVNPDDLNGELGTNDPKAEKGSRKEKDSFFVRPFIDFQGMILDVYNIKSFTKELRYDHDDSRLVWEIIVNKDMKTDLPYTNKVFPFYTEKFRDDAWGTLKEMLEETKTIIFIG
jgi:hypothetical protein